MNTPTQNTEQSAVQQVLTDAHKALIQWENFCGEFMPGHYKLRPEFSDCEVASHQAQVSIRQLINSAPELLAENQRLREQLARAADSLERDNLMLRRATARGLRSGLSVQGEQDAENDRLREQLAQLTEALAALVDNYNKAPADDALLRAFLFEKAISALSAVERGIKP